MRESAVGRVRLAMAVAAVQMHTRQIRPQGRCLAELAATVQREAGEAGRRCPFERINNDRRVSVHDT